MLLMLSSCSTSTISTGEVEVYFCHLADCASVLIEATKNANQASCAFYDLNNKELIANLHNIDAQLIVDQHVVNIPFAKKRFGDGIMHHKFCIINDSVVYTGSFNPTSNDDYNNLLRIDSPSIAHHFQEIFDQLLKEHHSASKHTIFIHNNQQFELYACPQDDCQTELLGALQNAQHSIRFALFTFTDDEVASILLKKHQKGIIVEGVVESFQNKQYAQHLKLIKQGVPIVIEDSTLLQHNKVFVIDNRTVITGSYNPTRAASTINDEMLLIIDFPQLASSYNLAIDDIIWRTQNFK